MSKKNLSKMDEPIEEDPLLEEDPLDDELVEEPVEDDAGLGDPLMRSADRLTAYEEVMEKAVATIAKLNARIEKQDEAFEKRLKEFEASIVQKVGYPDEGKYIDDSEDHESEDESGDAKYQDETGAVTIQEESPYATTKRARDTRDGGKVPKSGDRPDAEPRRVSKKDPRNQAVTLGQLETVLQSVLTKHVPEVVRQSTPQPLPHGFPNNEEFRLLAKGAKSRHPADLTVAFVKKAIVEERERLGLYNNPAGGDTFGIRKGSQDDQLETTRRIVKAMESDY